MSDPKFITYFNGNFTTGVIFDPSVNHADMVKRLCDRKDVVGAGFVRIVIAATKDGAAVECRAYGESVSLGVKSTPGDSLVLSRVLNIDRD